MFQEQIIRIKEKLEQLKSKDNKLRLFGTTQHKYELNNVLSSEVIEEFEKSHKISLPSEYRHFLAEIGDGGAGPFYGVIKLEDSVYADMDFRAESELVNPSLPFPHTEAQWVYPEGVDEAEELEEDEFNKIWKDPKHIQGIIRLCNFGCGVHIGLVVNGEEYGNMWSSDLSSEVGIYPSGQLANEPERITFLDWYELWLDNSHKEFKK